MAGRLGIYASQGEGVPPVDLLLDKFEAVSGLSVRKIKKDATVAFGVRRSSDNAEQPIGFIGEDLDTADLLSFCGAGDGFITFWNDQTGKGNQPEQSAASKQPKIVVAGVLIEENLRAALDFAVASILQLVYGTPIEVGTSVSVTKMNTIQGVNYAYGQDALTGGVNSGLGLGGTAAGFDGLSLFVDGTTITLGNPENTNQQINIQVNGATKNLLGVNAYQGTDVTDGGGPIVNEAKTLGARRQDFGSADAKIQEFIIFADDQTDNLFDIVSDQNAYFNVFADEILNLYPNELSGHALFKLIDTATECVVVRRASDQAEQTFGFDADGYLDGAAVVAFAQGGDAFVAEIKGQGPSAANVSNTLAAEQPQIVTAGVLETINGFPALTCAADKAMIGAELTIPAADITTFTIAEAAINHAGLLYVLRTPTNNLGYFPEHKVSEGWGTLTFVGPTTSEDITQNQAGGSVVPAVVTSYRDADEISVRVNQNGADEAVATGAVIGDASLSLFSLNSGAGSRFNGKWAASIAYNSDQRAAQDTIIKILNRKYNIFEETYNFGNGLKFNGVDSLATFTQVPLSVGEAFTIGYWISGTRSGAGLALQELFFLKNANNYIWHGVDNNRARLNSQPSINWLDIGANIYDGNRHLIIFTRNASGDTSLYVDGIGSATNPISYDQAGNFDRLGDGSVVGAQYWADSLYSDVWISKTETTPQQVNELWNEGKGQKVDSVITPLHYWRMNGKDGDVVVPDEMGTNPLNLANFTGDYFKPF